MFMFSHSRRVLQFQQTWDFIQSQPRGFYSNIKALQRSAFASFVGQGRLFVPDCTNSCSGQMLRDWKHRDAQGGTGIATEPTHFDPGSIHCLKLNANLFVLVIRLQFGVKCVSYMLFAGSLFHVLLSNFGFRHIYVRICQTR